MSALPEDSVQDGSIDGLHQQQLAGNDQQIVQQVQSAQGTPSISEGSTRKRMYRIVLSSISTNLRPAKAPSVRRACVACHTGKTRCSEVLPCQVGISYPLSPLSCSQTHSRVVSSVVWGLPVLILILMHRAATTITTTVSMSHLIPVSQTPSVFVNVN